MRVQSLVEWALLGVENPSWKDKTVTRVRIKRVSDLFFSVNQRRSKAAADQENKPRCAISGLTSTVLYRKAMDAFFRSRFIPDMVEVEGLNYPPQALDVKI